MTAHIVAAIQTQPVFKDIRKNIASSQQLVFEALAKGARVVVLPELCLSGYAFDNSQEAHECAQTKNGYQTEAFLPLAHHFNAHIVFGYVELSEANLYNSAAIVGPRGLEGNAQKHNLYGRDALVFQPSEAMPPIVLTQIGRLGVLICRDVSNNYRNSYYAFQSEHRFYRKGDTDCIALCTNWGSNQGWPDNAWVELVESTRTNVIVSNRVGKERNLKFGGGTCIIDKNRRIWTNGSNFTHETVVGGIIH